MKRILLITFFLLSGIWLQAQEFTKPSGLLTVQNAGFYINPSDTSIWIYKGSAQGWQKLTLSPAVRVSPTRVTIDRDLHVSGNITASKEVTAWMAGAVSSDVLSGLTGQAPLFKVSSSVMGLHYDPATLAIVGGNLTVIGGTGTGTGTGGGTVTSVDLSLPAEFSLSGNPITIAGTLAAGWNDQAAGKVFASQATGTGRPTFRTLSASEVGAATIAHDHTVINGISIGNQIGATKEIQAVGLNVKLLSGDGAHGMTLGWDGGLFYDGMAMIHAGNLPAYPTSLPANDVYQWAKNAVKPAYSYTEIAGIPELNYLPLTGGKLTGQLSVPEIDLPGQDAWKYIKNSGANGGIKIATANASGTLIDCISVSSGGGFVRLQLPTTVTGAITATGGSSTDWNEAHSWGDHAVVGYALAVNIPTTLPASDVRPWAKEFNKPTYAYSELTTKPSNLSEFYNDLGNFGNFVTGTPWASVGYALQTDLNAHTVRTDNPHAVTKSQVGLSNSDNTSDINKPISAAQNTAITGVQTNLNNHAGLINNPHAVTALQVGLNNVTNESKSTMFTNPTFTGAVNSPQYNIGSISINTAGVLSNVAYRNKNNDFVTGQTIYGTITATGAQVNGNTTITGQTVTAEIIAPLYSIKNASGVVQWTVSVNASNNLEFKNASGVVGAVLDQSGNLNAKGEVSAFGL